MTGTRQDQAGSKTSRNIVLQAGRYAIALSAVAGIVLSATGFSSAAQAAAAAPSATARIQSLLNNPVSGTVNLPRGTFTVRPDLVLHQGERIVGHHTTLKVASGSGNYAAVLAWRDYRYESLRADHHRRDFRPERVGQSDQQRSRARQRQAPVRGADPAGF